MDDPQYEKTRDGAFDYIKTHRVLWAILDTPDGYEVHQHVAGGIMPPVVYPTKRKAIARVMQIMGIGTAVSPQDWPEDVAIGDITTIVEQ